MVLNLLPVFLAGCSVDGERSVLYRTSDVWGKDDVVPSARVIKGKPNVLDFGDGLKIPLNQYAFLTLWDGKTFWMTYGAGRASRAALASGAAVRSAEATMQLLLLTLAFAPDRLEQKDGGWRLKQQDIRNYVRGLLALPGKPFAPQTDARLGFGNMDTAYAAAEMAMASLGQSAAMPGEMRSRAPVDLLGDNKVDSFTSYIIRKKDVDLDYVRKFAVLDTLGASGQK